MWEINDNPRGNREFDPNDPWDDYVVENYGRPMYDSLVEKKDNPSDADYFDNGVGFLSGRQFSSEENEEDDFGAFSDVRGQFVVDMPDKILTPEMLRMHMNGQYRVQIDYAAYGQPDGPDTEGHIWIARLYDTKEKKEVPESRTAGDKLSWVISAACKKMPDYGKEIMKTDEDVIVDRINRRIRRMDGTLEHIEEMENHLEAIYTQFDRQDIYKILLDANPNTADMFMEGDLETWFEKTLQEIHEEDDGEKRLNALRKIDNILAVLSQVFEKVCSPYREYLLNLESESRGTIDEQIKEGKKSSKIRRFFNDIDNNAVFNEINYSKYPVLKSIKEAGSYEAWDAENYFGKFQGMSVAERRKLLANLENDLSTLDEVYEEFNK